MTEDFSLMEHHQLVAKCEELTAEKQSLKEQKFMIQPLEQLRLQNLAIALTDAESRLSEADFQGKVRVFHEKFGFTINEKPTQLSNKLWRIRYNHTLDELLELQLAEQSLELNYPDGLEKVADALGDILYFVFGTAVAHGIDMTPIFNEIHRSNMTKIKPEGDAKAIKSEGYSPPDIKKALRGVKENKFCKINGCEYFLKSCQGGCQNYLGNEKALAGEPLNITLSGAKDSEGRVR